jgi:hypothetical protein
VGGWACVGSANLNRRSSSHDGGLSAAVLDAERDGREPADLDGVGSRPADGVTPDNSMSLRQDR